MRLSSVCHTAFLKQEKKKKTKPILVNFKSQIVMFCLPQVRNLTSPPISELKKNTEKNVCKWSAKVWTKEAFGNRPTLDCKRKRTAL